FMRLAYLIGYGVEMERSPVNSASLSMLPWPKPAVWPLVPPDASADILEKEKMIHQSSSRVKHFNIERKPLPLEPSLLLREANRRRASLSVGNAVELFDGRWVPMLIIRLYLRTNMLGAKKPVSKEALMKAFGLPASKVLSYEDEERKKPESSRQERAGE
ncbi:trafficking protein particle complex II-specific subunit 130 homolog, partial [Phalaenopsis equestris]|uniref:trafficking protein particle complex II-specific subunit 130 homolog n=1 Tax=Phalaenopsis equestris TaxID=78828 RepID=UPI0009E5FE6F